LLVAIAVIAILAALLLPVLSKAKARGKSIACLSNMRQFGLAFQIYAGDHDDSVLPNQDGKGVPLGKTWVEGWLGIPGPDCTNTVYLRNSLIGLYVKDVSIWRCPAAYDPVVRGKMMPRVRTVSLNCFMGASSNSVPDVAIYRRLADIARPSPSEALVFLEERVDTINDGTFEMQWNFDAKTPNAWILRDKPGALHDNGCNLTYADGRAKCQRCRDWRTVSPPRNDARLPGDVDVLWLQQHGTSREQ
jgi:prepilin-type processing-associated H-X9-DG protein